jgi:large subunit ribosomal protein L30
VKKVRLTWVRSTIGQKSAHRKTIEALGLRRLNHTVEKELTPQIAGMVAQVSYLLKIEELGEA